MDDPPCTSSSSSVPKDVFLSFRGEDTRKTFINHLHKALEGQSVNVYLDNIDLEKGNNLSVLLLAIAESKISIVVLSENYGNSTWCLKELVKIMECKKQQNQVVMPVFYRVDPSHIRKQTGSYGEAFAKHEGDKKLVQEEVRSWRSALTEVSNIVGWSSEKYENDTELIAAIVREVSVTLIRISPCTPDGLVAMDPHLNEMKRLMNGAAPNDVVYVGICGMGGLGKTTIAIAVFFTIRHEFDNCCFLRNVREGFLKNDGDIKKRFQSEISGHKVDRLDEGGYTRMLKGLGKRKILVVLDDVLNSIQIDTLLGEEPSFGGGSRIIVTTRDEHVLCGFKVYKPEPLSEPDSLKLFNQKAKPPSEEYDHLSRCIVRYVRGLPLALKALGALLRGRSVSEWEDQFKKMKIYPYPDIEKILKISYDGLDGPSQNMFLDIACFFNGWDKDYVTQVFESCGFFPNSGLNVLVERALVTISDLNTLEMHDLVQDMGRAIESNTEGRPRRRFWGDDAESVLIENTATEFVEGLMIDLPSKENRTFNAEAFGRMRKLRLFIFPDGQYAGEIHLTGDFNFLSSELRVLVWHGCPLKCLPSNFDPKNLVHLDMKYSNIEQLWEGSKPTEKLISLDLRDSHLKNLPSSFDMKYLKTLAVCRCLNLKMLPEISVNMDALSELDLSNTAIKKLPSSIDQVRGLKSLDMTRCRRLVCLPDSICKLAKLRSLKLERCPKLYKLPEDIGSLGSLSHLDVSESGLKQLPVSVLRLKLRLLRLFGCKRLVAPLSSWPSSIEDRCKTVVDLDFSRCNMMELSDAIAYFSSLKVLNLSHNNLESLPATMNRLAFLERLILWGCKRLKSIPELPSSISYINADDCTALEAVSTPKYPYQTGRCFIFSNCDQLVKKDVFRFIVDTHFLQGNLSRPFFLSLPGSEIPEQFIHQCMGSSVTAKLPQNWFDNKFLGFAICAVTNITLDNTRWDSFFASFSARCLCTFKGDHCKYSFSFDLLETTKFQSDHIVVGYAPWSESGMINNREEVNKRHYTYANFEIELDTGFSEYVSIARCGVRFFFGDNVEDFGQAIVEVDGSDKNLEWYSAEPSDTSDEDESYLRLSQVFEGAASGFSDFIIEDDEDISGKRNSLERWTQVIRVTSGLGQGVLDDGFTWSGRIRILS